MLGLLISHVLCGNQPYGNGANFILDLASTILSPNDIRTISSKEDSVLKAGELYGYIVDANAEASFSVNDKKLASLAIEARSGSVVDVEGPLYIEYQGTDSVLKVHIKNNVMPVVFVHEDSRNYKIHLINEGGNDDIVAATVYGTSESNIKLWALKQEATSTNTNVWISGYRVENFADLESLPINQFYNLKFFPVTMQQIIIICSVVGVIIIVSAIAACCCCYKRRHSGSVGNE